MIGDFGMTLYFGKNEELQGHLRKALKVDRDIYDTIKVGQKFSDVHAAGQRTIQESGLTNIGLSVTDPSGINLGHTVPFSYEDLEEEVIREFESGNVASAISSRRKFISSDEALEVCPGMAFSLEPRMRSTKIDWLPLVSYHTIVLMNTDGSKELLEGFDDLFKLAGMWFMLG